MYTSKKRISETIIKEFTERELCENLTYISKSHIFETISKEAPECEIYEKRYWNNKILYFRNNKCKEVTECKLCENLTHISKHHIFETIRKEVTECESCEKPYVHKQTPHFRNNK